MKKFEETSQKYRDLQQTYNLLNDKYTKMCKERAGIEESLSNQVAMYKKLLEEMEENAEKRLKEVQENCKKGI